MRCRPDAFVAVCHTLWSVLEQAIRRYAIALALALSLDEDG